MFAVIPKVDRVVVRRMVGVLCENLLQNGIQPHMTRNGNAFTVKLPTPTNQQGLGLEIIGII